MKLSSVFFQPGYKVFGLLVLLWLINWVICVPLGCIPKEKVEVLIISQFEHGKGFSCETHVVGSLFIMEGARTKKLYNSFCSKENPTFLKKGFSNDCLCQFERILKSDEPFLAELVEQGEKYLLVL